MIMKQISILTIWVMALMAVSCQSEDPMTEAGSNQPVLRITTAPMTIYGEQVPYDTRATEPLYPEYENSIYSLAVLVFDVQEGVLQRFPAENAQSEAKYYKYTNLRDKNGAGLLNYTLKTEDFPVTEGVEYTVCLIGNLTEEAVADIVDGMLANDGTAYLNEFKNVSVAIPYIRNDNDPSGLKIGHVSDIYMFGYYEGVVKGLKNSAGVETTELSITLGRIISRLEMVFTVDGSVTLDEDKTFYCRMNNLESHAHLFPTGVSPGADDSSLIIPGVISELTSLNDGQSTIYFYAAPHSAETAEAAMSLDLWYTDKNANTSTLGDPHATIQLCNDQPVDDRNYYLNRNSVYRFNFNLTYQP